MTLEQGQGKQFPWLICRGSKVRFHLELYTVSAHGLEMYPLKDLFIDIGY